MPIVEDIKAVVIYRGTHAESYKGHLVSAQEVKTVVPSDRPGERPKELEYITLTIFKEAKDA